jgi:hypothetical protein
MNPCTFAVSSRLDESTISHVYLKDQARGNALVAGQRIRLEEEDAVKIGYPAEGRGRFRFREDIASVQMFRL